MNEQLAVGIGSLFGRNEASDCTVSCYLIKEPNSNTTCLNPGLNPGATDEETLVGEPLPCHQLVLLVTSKRFAAQLSGRCWHGDKAVGPVPDEEQAGTQDRKRAKPCPELRVSVSGEAEVPYVKDAIRYAYTGQVNAESVREALGVLKMGDYLDISGCAAACLKAIDNMLSASSASHSQQELNLEGGSIVCSISSGGAVDAAFELYACHALWPSNQTGLDFAATLKLASRLVVSHFGDALATLNSPLLRQQLLALPAVAVEALLESDDFGTDSESSTLLLLATWMKENLGSTDAGQRERLCRLLRLAQLSPPYLAYILPALALDFEAGKGWFPIKVLEAGLVARVAAMTQTEKALFAEYSAVDARLLLERWYSRTGRRQCVPEDGLAYSWHVTQEALLAAEGKAEGVKVSLPSVASSGLPATSALGFDWIPELEYRRGAGKAGLNLKCRLPDAYRVEGSRLHGKPEVPVWASIKARLIVDSRDEAAAKPACNGLFGLDEPVMLGRLLGWDDCLPLLQQQANANGGEAAAAVSAQWSGYLRGGKVTGRLKLLR